MAWFLILLTLAALAAVALYIRTRHWPRLRDTTPDEPRCAHCGYDLNHLDIPRCPECGALRGFRVPLTELGLTEQEVRDGVARRRTVDTDTPEPPDGPPNEPTAPSSH